MSAKAKSRNRTWLLLAGALVLVTLALNLTYPLEELSRRASDLQLRLRPALPTSSQVALVVIDDDSLARFGRWPWSRSLLARLLRQVNAAQPSAIGLDIVLSEPSAREQDQELAESIRDAGNVVLAARLSAPPDQSLWVEPLPVFAQAATGIGHVQAITGPDGICRSLPVQEVSAAGLRWAMALEVFGVATKVRLRPESNGVSAGKTFLPTQGRPGGSDVLIGEKFAPAIALIDFRQQWVPNQAIPPFMVVSAADVLDGKPVARLRNKAILVGLSAMDASDHVFTPVSDRLAMPGVELHANLVDSLMEGRALKPASTLAQFLLLVALSLASTWFALRWPGFAGLAIVSVLLAGVLVFNFIALVRAHVILSLAPLMCAILLAFPLAQLESLVSVNRAVNHALVRLRNALSASAAGSKALRSEHSASWEQPDLSWKLDLLDELQGELESLYNFRQSLLIAMEEGVAAYGKNGTLLFQNPRWDVFCSSQGWPADLNLEELEKRVGKPDWHKLSEPLADRDARAEIEVQSGDSLWQLRALRVQTVASGTVFMLVATDLSLRLERDRARAEALGFVTHELLTPLTSIQGFAEFLVRYQHPQPGGGDAAQTIFRESRRLVALINTYLDVLRMDAGGAKLKRENVDIRELVVQVQRIMHPLAEAAQSRVTSEIAPRLPRLQGDPSLIAGALLNLLNNGVKYSPRGSEIRLKVSASEGKVIFEVSNPGSPIPGNDLVELFHSFYRGRQEAGAKRGWGLGLAFVKRIADAHGGTVEAVSDSSDTVFRIALPSAAQQRAYPA